MPKKSLKYHFIYCLRKGKVYRLSRSADVHIGFSEDSEVSGETVAIILQEKQISTTNAGMAERIWNWGCLQASSGGANL